MNIAKTGLLLQNNQDRLFSGSAVPAGYIWNNVITEKRDSVNWLSKLYEGSIFDDVWSIISSKVH